MDLDPVVEVIPDATFIEPEIYPRLVPWELNSLSEENGASTLLISALSYACKPYSDSDELITETFDHVTVSETTDTVVIQTWLGPPEGDGFGRGCTALGWGFLVEVRTMQPLGDRILVDPACELDRYAHWVACERSKLDRLG